ncbi:MAG: hypothetical protein E6G68_07940 [Actinobacteria bacterium]|nr:MAG: hypothetical protein E6G68_07940 [Actinomycetota bacterium]
MRRLGAIVAVLLFALTTLPAGGAPGDLGVAPGIGIRSTGPGRTVEESVTVVNLSEDDFSVTGSLTDVVVDEKGTFSTVDHGSGLPSAAAWGVVDPATFVLPRGHTQTVKLSFTPPKTTVGGGYYTAARFTGQSGRGTTTSATHAVLLEVAGNALLRAAKIASLSAPERSFGSTIPVSLTLENTGNVYAVAQGRLVVRDQFSRVTAELDIGRTPVVPGTRRVLRINAPPPLIPGRVRVKVELGFGLGVPEDAASTTVYAVAWWHLAAAAVLLLVLIRFIVGLVRGRLGHLRLGHLRLGHLRLGHIRLGHRPPELRRHRCPWRLRASARPPCSTTRTSRRAGSRTTSRRRTLTRSRCGLSRE